MLLDGFHSFRLGVTAIFSAELELTVCKRLGPRWCQLPDLDGPRCLGDVSVALLWNNAFPCFQSHLASVPRIPVMACPPVTGEARLLAWVFPRFPLARRSLSIFGSELAGKASGCASGDGF